MKQRLAVLLIVATLMACAALSSHQHKPFPTFIDEAKAATIVCNPVLTGIPAKKKDTIA